MRFRAHARAVVLTESRVRGAGIPWLINKYKQYILMRERVLKDTQSLRTKLKQSIKDPASFRGEPSDHRPPMKFPIFFMPYTPVVTSRVPGSQIAM
jgi:hypothetical protein